MKQLSISIIIPAYNEEAVVVETVRNIRQRDTDNFIKEIIVADGGSTDSTLHILKRCNVRVVSAPVKGRAPQMNFGARFATGNILYFLHADTTPPVNFSREIVEAIADGYHSGCFLLSFDDEHWFLRASAWLTRFDVDSIRFGDQSLFVSKEIFDKSGGFDDHFILLEDQDMVKRLKRFGSFTIIKKPVITSARKYHENGIFKTQFIYFFIYIMYRLGFSQDKLVKTYCKLIRKNKFSTNEAK